MKNGVVNGMKIEKRTSYICFRVSPREKAEYKKVAEDKGISLGRLIRSAVDELMNRPPVWQSNGGIENEKE